jgi:RHS repeat-associated protein
MADERGSITSVTSGSGAVLGINRYDEYGVPSPGNIGHYGYTGQTWLPDIGMNYFKARIYSPKRGRFLQSVPIGYDDGMNMYAYVGNDPINARDPSGMCTKFTQIRSYYQNGVLVGQEVRGISYSGCGFEGGDSSSVPSTPGAPPAPGRGAEDDDIVVTGKKSKKKNIDCNSGARQLANFGSNAALAFGGATVVFAALGAEPVAAGTAAITLAFDIITLGAGLYVWYSEGDSSVVKSSFIGAAGGAVGGILVKGFGGSITREAGGVLVNRASSKASIEAGSYASGNGGQALVNGICR